MRTETMGLGPWDQTMLPWDWDRDQSWIAIGYR